MGEEGGPPMLARSVDLPPALLALVSPVTVTMIISFFSLFFLSVPIMIS